MELIQTHIPNLYHHSFFSALTKNSHIMPHYGPTNKKLRFHLPLMGVSGSRMRVGNETRQQEEGKAYVFDDSFEHEAWHDGEETRLILIVDFWHTDLTAVEIKLLKVLQNAMFKAEAIISEADPDKDNFYSIIEGAKDLIKDNGWWVVSEEEAKS
jgi:aspartate beta-hydroxylase